MEMLTALRTRVPGLLEALGSARYRYLAGLSVEVSLSVVRAPFADLGRPEAYAAASEAATSSRQPEHERAYYAALRPWLAQDVLAARASRATEEISAFEAQQEVALTQQTLPLREAQARLAAERSHERRGADANAISTHLLAHRGAYARRVDAMLEAIRSLGFDSGGAMRAALGGGDDAAQRAEVEALLSQTEDAYRDVLGYVLKKLEPTLRPLPNGGAALWDLEAAALGPAVLTQLPPREGLSTLERWLLEWGFHPTANGHLRVDQEERPGKRGLPFVAVVKVPQEVRLGVRPGSGGTLEFTELARAYGEALRIASIPTDAGLSERRLGEPSVAGAYGTLFALALGQERWHQRYLSASRIQAKEAARLAAFFELAALRQRGAEALFHLALESRGPAPALTDEHAGQLESALFLRAPKGTGLQRPRLGLGLWVPLRARRLGHALAAFLQQRFDEDWFRNPAAAAWLRERWRRPERDEERHVLAAVERTEKDAPTLVEAGRRLSRALEA